MHLEFKQLVAWALKQGGAQITIEPAGHVQTVSSAGEMGILPLAFTIDVRTASHYGRGGHGQLKTVMLGPNGEVLPYSAEALLSIMRNLDEMEARDAQAS
jgi:hypothetical protein